MVSYVVQNKTHTYLATERRYFEQKSDAFPLLTKMFWGKSDQGKKKKIQKQSAGQKKIKKMKCDFVF